jgi:hypothetical protein
VVALDHDDDDAGDPRNGDGNRMGGSGIPADASYTPSFSQFAI